MDLDSEFLLEAGRTIRPYLDDLALDVDERATLDHRLATALVEPDRRSAGARVLELLTACPPAAEWLVDFTRLGVPPELDDGPAVRGGGSAWGGDGEVVRAGRFCCPVAGDYVWYRRTVAQPIRSCPTHQLRLVPDLAPPPIG
ncbi:MAG: hypothetical protein M3083_13015 [Actinomycetota bacterium]|nr:hypothetical protein [Actinomycetota bacterium]